MEGVDTASLLLDDEVPPKMGAKVIVFPFGALLDTVTDFAFDELASTQLLSRCWLISFSLTSREHTGLVQESAEHLPAYGCNHWAYHVTETLSVSMLPNIMKAYLYGSFLSVLEQPFNPKK